MDPTPKAPTEIPLSRRQYVNKLLEEAREVFLSGSGDQIRTIRAQQLLTELNQIRRETGETDFYQLDEHLNLYNNLASIMRIIDRQKSGDPDSLEIESNLNELRRLVAETPSGKKANLQKAYDELQRIISKHDHKQEPIHGRGKTTYSNTDVADRIMGMARTPFRSEEIADRLMTVSESADALMEAAQAQVPSTKQRLRTVHEEMADDIIRMAGKSQQPIPSPNSSLHSFGEAVERLQAKITAEAKYAIQAYGKEKAREMLIKELSLSKMSVELAKNHPLMDRLYPRHYDNVGNYFSPKTTSSFLLTVAIANADQPSDRWPAAHRLLSTALPQLVQKRVPMFFISPALLDAVLKTDFKDDINWQTLELPFESGIFMLPLDAVKHPTDGNLAFLVWNRAKAATYEPIWPGVPRVTVAHDHFSIVGMCPRDGVWYDSSLTAAVRPTLKLHNLFYLDNGEEMPTLINKTTWDEETTGPDADFIELMGVIVFGTFLAMNARPELLEKATLLKRVPAKREGPPKEFWSPNFVGRKYQAKRSEPQGGTHASPRMHWRRGHFRNQPYGPSRKERKTIWMEPCLIGANQ